LKDRTEIKPHFFESHGGFFVRVQQSRGGFQKTRLYFSIHTVVHQKMTEVTQNKDALSTKKPLSAPGFIARAQQSRCDFRNMRL
jgi:hypothetical protein